MACHRTSPSRSSVVTQFSQSRRPRLFLARLPFTSTTRFDAKSRIEQKIGVLEVFFVAADGPLGLVDGDAGHPNRTDKPFKGRLVVVRSLGHRLNRPLSVVRSVARTFVTEADQGTCEGLRILERKTSASHCFRSPNFPIFGPAVNPQRPDSERFVVASQQRTTDHGPRTTNQLSRSAA